MIRTQHTRVTSYYEQMFPRSQLGNRVLTLALQQVMERQLQRLLKLKLDAVSDKNITLKYLSVLY